MAEREIEIKKIDRKRNRYGNPSRQSQIEKEKKRMDIKKKKKEREREL